MPQGHYLEKRQVLENIQKVLQANQIVSPPIVDDERRQSRMAEIRAPRERDRVEPEFLE